MSTSSSSTGGDSSSSAIAAVAIVVLVVIALIAGVILFTRWNPFVPGSSGGETDNGGNPMPTLALPTMAPATAAPRSSGADGLYLQVDS